MQSYHYAWLSAHPDRDTAWLRRMMKEGFHIHHVDGDHSNDAPSNLVLIDGVDHMRLHSTSLKTGISNWRRASYKNGLKAMTEMRKPPEPPALDRLDLEAAASRIGVTLPA